MTTLLRWDGAQFVPALPTPSPQRTAGLRSLGIAAVLHCDGSIETITPEA